MKNLLFVLFVLVLPGCSLMSFFHKETNKEASNSKNEREVSSIKSYQQQDRLPNIEQRQYQRMTRERLERENDLHAGAGSMWVMEGQRSYLFAQNKARNEGDILSVQLEGSLRKQAENKVAVIKKLLDEIEAENKRYLEADKDRRMASLPAESNQSSNETKAEQSQEVKIEVDFIPAKIVEKLSDGNYRIRGSQNFMIGTKEFKIVLTGVVRAEDFSEDGISSNKLLDSDVDVLSVKKQKSEVR